ncbi:hypothetical protein ACIP9X_18545 [Arthrobacter sp. NPDC093125]|uniref:hypothetical protein n=1 Tax=Arthrobacter sp. NPDC093125 TaxID=3363944 RepID=UPI00380D691C
MSMTVTSGTDSESRFPETAHDHMTNEPGDSFDRKDEPALEGSAARESLIPKIFPVYAFI